MKALEFIAKMQDGIIKVPKKYVQQFTKQVRIIVLMEDASAEEKKPAKVIKKAKKKLEFKALSIDTRGLFVDRDEANAR